VIAGEKKIHLRHELKYQINMLQYQVLQKKLSAILEPDPNMKSNNKYSIRNLYFDDFRDTALCEKQAGVPYRKKYRIRIYNHSDAFIKFERKSKIGQYIFKESTKITRGEADRIILKDFNFLAKSEEQLLRDFYLETRCNLIRPVAILEYDREAYIHPIGNVRITFDTGLRTEIGATSFFDSNICTMSILDQTDIIMEIKYDEVLPQYICGVFPNTIRPKLALGKFAFCRTQQKCQTGNLPCGVPSNYE
jgi:hypothetical protein